MMKVRQQDAENYSRSVPGSRAANIPIELAGVRIDRALAHLFPEYSRNRLQSWLKAGRVCIDGFTIDARYKPMGGETLTLKVEMDAVLASDLPEDIALDILYEDHDLIVVDKPPGLVVHPGNGNRDGTLLNALLNHAPELAKLPRAGIVHRLDKDTSGLLVVARTAEAQLDLVRQLQARTVSRQYLALVFGTVSASGTVDAPIGRHPTLRTRMAVNLRGRDAKTFYIPRESFPMATLVECRLDTGRTHQIRVHMMSIGHPIVGDQTYGRVKCGFSPVDRFPRQALHAWRLALIHPSRGTPCSWNSDIPEDFALLLEQIRRGLT